MFGFGLGKIGQLGQEEMLELRSLTALPSLADIDPMRVSCGWGHSAVVDRRGSLFVFGRSHDFENTLKSIIHLQQDSMLGHFGLYLANRFARMDRTYLLPTNVTPPGVTFTSAACSPGAATFGVTGVYYRCLPTTAAFPIH